MSPGHPSLAPRSDFPVLDATRPGDAGVIVSPRLGAVRFSLHVFNDSSDVERALGALGEIL